MAGPAAAKARSARPSRKRSLDANDIAAASAGAKSILPSVTAEWLRIVENLVSTVLQK